MIKIAIVTRRLSGRGGMETAIRTLIAAARERSDGPAIAVWLMGSPHRSDWLDGVTHRIWRIDRGTGRRFQLKAKLPLYALALAQAIRQHPVDMMWVTDPTLLQAALWARRGLRHPPKVVSWLHFSLRALANVTYLKNADGHLAISEGLAEEIRQLRPRVEPVVVYNALPRGPFPILSPAPSPHFVYIGRLANRQKRLDVLLQGLAPLPGDWRLTVFGDGPDRAAIQSLAATLAPADRIRFAGWVNDPWAQITAVTALLLTSDFEGFPMVLLEALARGVPVIATDCPTGPRDIVRPGQNGYLIPPGQHGALSEAARRLLQTPSPLSWGPQRIQADALTRFGPEVVLTRMLNALAR